MFSSGGSLNVAAYSEQIDIGSNASVSTSVTLGGAPASSPGQFRSGVGITSQRIAVPNGTKISPLTGKVVPNFVYSGPVAQIKGPNGFALSKGQLTMPGDQVSITSTTGGYTGMASVFNRTNPLIGVAFPKYGITAEASEDDTGEVIPGDASALAGDPVSIPAGTYAYDPSLDCSVNLDKSNEQGAARVYAVDAATFTSDTVDNFSLNDEPQDQALWSLVMNAGTPIHSISDLQLDFYLNPLALREITFPSSYLSALGPYSDATSEALLIDQSIDNAIAGAITFTGAEADLTGFNPFPDGTTYTPLADGEAYADGADAAIAAPEPGALCLFILALPLLHPRRRGVNLPYN